MLSSYFPVSTMARDGNGSASEMQPFSIETGWGGGLDGDEYRFSNRLIHAPKPQKPRWLFVLVAANGISLVMSIVALAIAARAGRWQQDAGGKAAGAADVPAAQQHLVSRIAFGSCTSYDLRPQTVWTQVPACICLLASVQVLKQCEPRSHGNGAQYTMATCVSYVYPGSSTHFGTLFRRVSSQQPLMPGYGWGTWPIWTNHW
jgi:hypothetical protein